MKTTEWKGAYSVRKKGLSSVGHRPVRSLIDLRRVLSSLEGPRGEAPPVAYESVDVNMHPVQVPQEAVPIIRGSRKGNPKTSETRETTSIRDIPDLADQKKVPVWSHDITIQLNTQAPSVNDFVTPDQASALGWAEEEQLLVESLALRSTSDQIEDFPLGDPVYIYLMDQRNAVFLKPLATRFASGAKRFISWENMDYVLNIPEFVDPSFDLPSHDFTHEHGYGDIIRAAVALQETDRATLEGKLTIQLLPEGGGHYNPRHELPLRLRLQLTLSLHNPAIFYPVSALTPNLAEAQRRVLYHVFGSPDQLHTDHAHTTIPFFYSILNPAPPLPLHLHTDAVQPRQLKARLLPFQKRSVHWLLEREGMSIDSSGTLIPRPPNEESDLPLFWKRVPSPLHSGRAGKSSSATDWYFNPVSGNVVSSIPPHEESPGGMLSDEMGLGKTIECLALIALHTPQNRSGEEVKWRHATEVEIQPIKSTLIVTPNSLLGQWVDEMKLHAPKLKVLVYDGWAKEVKPGRIAKLKAGNKSKRKPTAVKVEKYEEGQVGPSRPSRAASKRKIVDLESDSEEEEEEEMETLEYWQKRLNQYDVIITTYNILTKELTVAKKPPKRPRREVAQYAWTERPVSPLVSVEFTRVIMDEVQQVGNRHAAEMVSLIPRISSLAVSGTPAKSDIHDLLCVIKFLKVGAVMENNKYWNRLLQRGFQSCFKELFDKLGIRATKAMVGSELTIPRQTRWVVPVNLGLVEKRIYDDTFEQALQALHIDARGVPLNEIWELDVGGLRTWLRKLRQICTHPQVGQLSGNKTVGGAVKTIDEVLNILVETNRNALLTDNNTLLRARIKHAMLLQKSDRDVQRYQTALTALLAARQDAELTITELQKAIKALETKGAALRRERMNKEGREIVADDNGDRNDAGEIASSDDEDSLDPEPGSAAEQENRVKELSMKLRLREYLLLLHKICFLLGDVYHTQGQEGPENQSYGEAEELRRDLLKGTETVAMDAMKKLARDADKRIRKSAAEIVYCGEGGVRSRPQFTEANAIFGVLDEQRELLSDWRDRIFKFLTEPLSTNDGDGQEYARALETQGKAETYLQAYAALLADRKEVLTAERTALAEHDARERKLRHTKAAQRAAAATNILDLDQLPEELGEFEQAALQQDLTKQRKETRVNRSPKALKSVMFELRKIAREFEKTKQGEIAGDEASRLKEIIEFQGKYMEQLESELAGFRGVFNSRIQYFKQLQELSDSVVDVDLDGQTVEQAQEICILQITELEGEIRTRENRRVYLENLSARPNQADEDDGTCVLCKTEFTQGFLTPCAHLFCGSCLLAWIKKSREGKLCPMCRGPIEEKTLHKIAHRAPVKLSIPPERTERPRPRTKIKYNTIDDDELEQILSVKSFGQYGAKIQTLIGHLLLLKERDPSAKAIVFSAWADSLHIVEHALVANGITSLRIDSRIAKGNPALVFAKSPDIQVLLLHGERENAGLNVTVAKTVFLLESVVNHAFEEQAISRVDRLGQKNSTEVYCYYAEDTVEKSILDLAAKQGMSLYTEGKALGPASIDGVTTEKLQVDGSAKSKIKQKGDFVAKADDMLSIFFPHFDDLNTVIEESLKDVTNVPIHFHEARTNAVAGSSKHAGALIIP